MTTKRFRQGDVLYYPYRWKHQPPTEIEHPKDRPACIALMLKDRNGADVLTILPISDMPPNDLSIAIELTAPELAAIGLSDKRKAYIHVSEANVDDIANSFTVTPKTRIVGRLPQTTLKRMLILLKSQLLMKNIEITHRGRNG